MSTPPAEMQSTNGSRRQRFLTILLVVVLGVAALVGAYDLMFVRGYVSTDNAYVNGNIVQVTAQTGGTIVAVNERLEDAPELVHRDPYGAGWIARLRLTDFAADRVALLHGAPVTDAMARHARLHRQDWLPVTSSKPEP